MSSSGSWGGGGAGGSSPGGSSSDAAAQAKAAAKAKMFAERQEANERTMEYFAAGVCGIIALVSLLHWTRRLYVRYERAHSASKTPVWALPFVVVARTIHPVLLHRLPPFPSVSHFVLVFTYIVLNVVLLVTNIDTSSYATVAGNRAGWLAVGNLCVVVFLALKHTPMSPLSRTSYERLNPLHQLAGFLTIGMTIIHAIAYTQYFMSEDRAYMLRRSSDIAGIVAGFCMLLMGLVPLLLKSRLYEFFYTAHILTFIALIITTALHQPKTAEKVAIITIVAGSIWALDRIARFLRIALNSFGNSATVYPLPDGGTRVILAKAPVGTRAGKHVFLYLPAIKLFQTHPFSVVSHQDGGAEFVIHSRKGFTAALHAYAQRNPGTTIRASADGAYGAFPSPDSTRFDKVILIAGGSGASFTFGLAGNLLEHMESLYSASPDGTEPEQKRKLDVDFIWAVRGMENLTWFTPSLRHMRNHPHAPNVAVHLHVTRLPLSAGGAGAGSGSETDEPAPALPSRKKLEPISITGTEPGEGQGEAAPASPVGSASTGDSEMPITASSRRQTLLLEDEEKAIAALEAGGRGSVVLKEREGEKPLPATRDVEKAEPIQRPAPARPQTADSEEAGHAPTEAGSEDSSGSGSSHEGHPLRSGRPDLAALIDAGVRSTSAEGRVLIAASGPEELMRVVRQGAARNIRANGPGVEVHCETFGW